MKKALILLLSLTTFAYSADDNTKKQPVIENTQAANLRNYIEPYKKQVALFVSLISFGNIIRSVRKISFPVFVFSTGYLLFADKPEALPYKKSFKNIWGYLCDEGKNAINNCEAFLEKRKKERDSKLQEQKKESSDK